MMHSAGRMWGGIREQGGSMRKIRETGKILQTGRA
jgi:hypothetical protein